MGARSLLRNARHRTMITPVNPPRLRLIHISPSYQTVYRSFEILLEWALSIVVVLNRGGAPPQGGVKKFPGGREPLHARQHGKFFNGNVYLPNVTPVRILCRYMLFGLVPEEMGVGVKFLEVLQADIEPASQGCN